MTSNKLKLLFAGAGVGAVLAMAGISVAQTTTFNAEFNAEFNADPALTAPVVPGP